MAGSFPSPVRGWWWPGARFLFRVWRRTLVESLYLLTAPVIAAVGLLLALGGLCAGTAALLLPGRSLVVGGVLAPAQWFAGLERWRTAKVRSAAPGAEGAGRWPRPSQSAAVSDPGPWLDAAHAVVVFPVAVVTSVVTGLWWFTGLGAATSALRSGGVPAGSLRPMTLHAGSAQSHIALSLGLTSPPERLAFGTVAGLLLLLTLPLVTRACTAAQTGLGQALLSGASALHRRISGLEQERDTARAQTVAAVTAEAAALRRLERDIHDGRGSLTTRMHTDREGVTKPRARSPLRHEPATRPRSIN